jgi:RimJ/RimL family protein N-acetyltransferase
LQASPEVQPPPWTGELAGPNANGSPDQSITESVAGPNPAPLEGRRVALRPVWPDDHPFLYSLAVMPETGYRWRYRGMVPSYELFVRELTHGILAQFLVVDKKKNQAAGLVVCYSADMRHQYAHIAAIAAPEYLRTGVLLEASGLFVNYLFVTWPFRKLYGEAIDYAVHSYRSGLGRYFQQEGRLINHEYYGGRYWDLHIFALYRDTWEHGFAHRLEAQRGRQSHNHEPPLAASQ